MDSGFAVSGPVGLVTPPQVAAYLQCSTSALHSRESQAEQDPARG